MSLLPIELVAKKINLSPRYLTCYGNYMAKINLKSIDIQRQKGKLVLVTSTTPTPQGEGKTVTTIGISEGINYIGKKSIACIRQPSLGPIFGQKGGAAGGGRAEVVPMEQLNLHLTGDIHALTSAHNLASAALDARVFHEHRLGNKYTQLSGLNALNIDKERIVWPRVVDHNDRALREITINDDSVCEYKTRFDITAASELMVILALSTDIFDLRKRIGEIVLAYDKEGNEVTAEKLEVAGAMTAILQKTLEPTLMQTAENTPVIIHTGSFANIAHGNSSIIADNIALMHSDYVVTEAGFGSDMGMEKFFNIKARTSHTYPSCIVVVTTVKSIKANCICNSGNNHEILRSGCENLRWHIQNAKRYGLPVIVAINNFPDDLADEIKYIMKFSLANGADECEVSQAFQSGGKGASALAKKIIQVCEQNSIVQLLYPDEWTLKDKILTVAKTYGAIEVEYSNEARSMLEHLENDGYGNLPICIAKTPASISHDAKMKNIPEPFVFPVISLQLAKGAGFIKVLAGDIMTMPGLGLRPAYRNIDIDDSGNIMGL